MIIKLLDKTGETQYNDYVMHSDDTLLYVSIKYRDLLTEYLNDESFYLVAYEDNKVVGFLPCFLHRNRKYGNVMNSMPFYGSNGGIFADNYEIKKELLDAYFDLTRKYNCAASTIITSPFELDNNWYRQNCKPDFIDARIGQVTCFPDEAGENGEILRNSFCKVLNRNINKALKNRVEVKIENSEESLDFLFKTHRDNLEKIGGISKEHRFFTMFPKHFRAGQDYNIYVANIEDKRVAALLVFYFNRTVEYFTPVIVEEFRSLQPLCLIIFEAMKQAIVSGYRNWNWGGTWLSQEGVYKFKRKWGTTDFKYYYYTNVFDTNILKLDRNVIIDNYPNYFVYPFNGGIAKENE